VFRDSDVRWIYTIPAGDYLRVHWAVDFAVGGRYYYGHGTGHDQDGFALNDHFTFCKPWL
jgi:hypothetical protein